MSADLITLEDLKQDHKIQTATANDTTWDDTLSRIISGVSQAIATFCGRTFVAATETSQKIDGDGSVVLLVRYPVISITSIINDTTTVVETTNWEAYLKSGKIELTDGTVWTKGRKTITITYRHGYEVGSIPADLQMAAMTWASKKFFDIKDDRVGVSSRTSADGASISFAGSSVSRNMPDEVRALIEPYKTYGQRWLS